MSKALIIAAFATMTTACGFSSAYAKDNDGDKDRGEGAMRFSWTAEEICLGGLRPTFTSDGDVTNFYGQIPAFGSGIISFHPAASTATEQGVWMFFQQFFQQPPNGLPQNLFPARTSAGECTYMYQRGDGLSWTLAVPRAGCSGADTSGPDAGVKVTFTNGPKIHGQFAADLQSFVAHRNELAIEEGSDANGKQFERICMRMIQGVRLPDKNK